MVSGWVEHSDGNTYYCGTENEGWAYTGWQYLEPKDDLNSDEYDDQEWFNFKSSGKMRKGTTWYSKGRYYTFDGNGIMEDGRVVLENDIPGDYEGGAISKELKAGTYYFNENDGSVNGQMVTGKTTVTDDGETYYHYFDKTTGRAITDIVKDGGIWSRW